MNQDGSQHLSIPGLTLGRSRAVRECYCSCTMARLWIVPISQLYNLIERQKYRSVLFPRNGLFWRSIWGTCGELCIVGSQHALKQHPCINVKRYENVEKHKTERVIWYLQNTKYKFSAWFSDFANFYSCHFRMMSAWCRKHMLSVLRKQVLEGRVGVPVAGKHFSKALNNPHRYHQTCPVH